MTKLGKYLLLFATTLCFWQSALAQIDTDDLDLGRMLQPADTASFFEQGDFYVWDNSVVRDFRTGRYFLFYARWPKSIGYSSWLTHSRLLRAEANNAAGPYVGATEVLGASGGKGWDNISIFNVKVLKAGDRYALYYSASGGAIPADTLLRTGSRGYGDPLWMPLRNSQLSGVAFARNLRGRWRRSPMPVVVPDGKIITNIANNPAVAAKPDGGYLMMLKGDSPGQGHRHMIQAVAQSPRPEGPFRLETTPAFDSLSTEDATLWYDETRGRYYAIFHIAGQPYLGLITSTDGIEWKKARHFVVCRKEIPLTDGTVMKVERMERPAIYLENGAPAMLSVAIKQGDRSFICFFQIITNKGEGANREGVIGGGRGESNAVSNSQTR